MDNGQHIRKLEEAILHLSRAMNRLIEAHEVELPDRGSEEGRSGSRVSDRAINEAYEALEKAVDLVSMEEHEPG